MSLLKAQISNAKRIAFFHLLFLFGHTLRTLHSALVDNHTVVHIPL
jgi:hypothetical protein